MSAILQVFGARSETDQGNAVPEIVGGAVVKTLGHATDVIMYPSNVMKNRMMRMTGRSRSLPKFMGKGG